jgi:GNAT superfamily N-acetyltransferase
VTGASAGPIEVLALSPARRADRARFIAVPAPLYQGDPCYVRPLRREVHAMLDPSRNPWHRHAEMALFVARRGRQPVGRIAAIRDHSYDQVQAERVGIFGFFECVDDHGCAAALLGEAERWARERGATTMRGPISPSLHDECGTLVEGFDSPPMIQMPYNPPYHEGLLEACGYRKAQDLLAYEFRVRQDVRPALARIADAVEIHGEFRVRNVDVRRFWSEVEIVRRLYNAAWEVTWGFVQLTEEEMNWRAEKLKQLVDPRVTLLVETRRGAVPEPVGFALAVPNINEILAGLKGRLTPLALFRLVRGLRRVRTIRLMLLGVIPGYRKRGLEALLIRELHLRAARAGVERAELAYVPEENLAMNRTIRKVGGRHYKTYRIHDKPLA